MVCLHIQQPIVDDQQKNGPPVQSVVWEKMIFSFIRFIAS